MNKGRTFGVIFLALASVLLWEALSLADFSVRVLAFLCALASGALGLAYLVSHPGLLGKSPDGSLRFSRCLLFWPYHLLSYASLVIARSLHVAPFQEIVPGLFLGGLLLPWEKNRAAPLATASVLDLTSEFAEVGFLRHCRSYLCIPLLDGSAPTQAQLDTGIRFITERLPTGPVYVHCAMGHGRSATFVVAWLVASRTQPDLEHALRHVQRKRPGVNLHPGQLNALRDFAYAGRNL